MRPRFILAIASVVALSLPLGATTDRVLTAVPANAVSVGVVHLDQLRTGSLAARLFDETNKATLGGEGDEFLREAGLDPRKDVDTVAFAVGPDDDKGEPRPLVVAEGRFDVERLSAALVKRGATQQNVDGKALFVLPSSEEKGAVAFFDKRLALIGSPQAVTAAINALVAGGSHFRESGGIAAEIAHVPADASCWAVADVQRASRFGVFPKAPDHAQVPANAVAASMKMLQSVTMWAKDDGENLSFGGIAISSDAPTRDNVADMLRGMLAAWRMAAQEKRPELVDVIRAFTVNQDATGVSLQGSIPGAMLRQFAKGAGAVSSK